jgi:hypothetical protein
MTHGSNECEVLATSNLITGRCPQPGCIRYTPIRGVVSS